MNKISEKISKINHPDFRVDVVQHSNTHVLDVELIPTVPDRVTVLANVASTVITNTPVDGLTGMFEQWFLKANSAPPPDSSKVVDIHKFNQRPKMKRV